LGGPANPALANVKMPGKVGIERIRQMMKEVNHPDLEKILVSLYLPFLSIFFLENRAKRTRSKKSR